MQSTVRTAVLTTALLVATATAAAAHPGLRPSEVPAGGPVEVELVIPHGCAADGGEAEAGTGSPTVEIAVQQGDDVRFEPRPVQGWTITTGDSSAGWVDAGGATVDEFTLPALVEVSGDVGDVKHLSVYQECANGDAYRWAAVEGEDGDPAVTLTVAEGTPPPLPAPSPTPSATSGATPTPTTTAGPTTSGPSPAATPTPSPSTASATPTVAASAPNESSPSEVPSLLAEDADGSGMNAGAVAAIVAALVAISGGVYALNREPSDEAGEEHQ